MSARPAGWLNGSQGAAAVAAAVTSEGAAAEPSTNRAPTNSASSRRNAHATGPLSGRDWSDDAIGHVLPTARNRQRQKLCALDYLSFSVKPSQHHRAVGYASEDHEKRRPFVKFDREKFLLVSCQFVLAGISHNADYISSPDKMVDWTLVEDIRLSSCETVTCPICLQPPVAAKITKCGHVYCWSCILHCLAITSKRWCCCPICHQAVFAEELKGVKLRAVQRYTVGTTITMFLMCKSRSGLIALPVDDARCPYDGCALSVDDQCSQFCKILSASHEQLCSVWKRERDELEFQLSTADEESESVFTLQALEALKNKEEGLLLEEQPKEVDVVSLSNGLQWQCPPPSKHGRCRGAKKKPSPPRNLFFYQAQDGQYVFLHWLNVKCLNYEYGDLAKSPKQLSGEIVDMEEAVMDEAMRDKCKHLAHIPLGARVTFAELHLGSQVLSERTVDAFAAELKKRQTAREKKAIEEKRFADKALRWERSVMQDASSCTRYSSCRSESMPVSMTNPLPEDTVAGEEAAHSSSAPAELTQSSVSFAQVLRNAGSPAFSVDNTTTRESAPAFRDTFAVAVDRIFENLKGDGNVESAEGQQQDSSMKKNRKAKHRVLFST